jgi:hypothetical protein
MDVIEAMHGRRSIKIRMHRYRRNETASKARFWTFPGASVRGQVPWTFNVVQGVERLAATRSRCGQAAFAVSANGIADSLTSSVMTANLANCAAPKLVEIATSAASRPRAITIRPIREWL